MRQGQNTQEAARELYVAALNNDLITLRRLLEAGINPNIIFFHNQYDDTQYTTALHGAVFSRRAEAVELLLQYGADTESMNESYQTPIDINSQMPDQRIFALLTQQWQARINEMTQRQQAYLLDNPTTYREDELHKLGDAYNQTEKVPDDLGLETALNYIIDALTYIHSGVLEAEKYETYSDDRWQEDSKILRMIKLLAACAHYLRKHHPEITNRSPGINWEGLALIIRVHHYNPNFLGNYVDKDKLMRVAIHDIVLSGELEQIKQAIKALKADQNFRQDVNIMPKFSRFEGYYKDEYYVEYIEDAIKNFVQFRSQRSDYENRVALLRSLMIIGEALYRSSPIITAQFDAVDVSQTIEIRDILCHPERPRNHRAIEGILNGVNTINLYGHLIDLFRLMDNLSEKYQIILNYLSSYYQDYLPQYIWKHISNTHLSLTSNVLPSQQPNQQHKIEDTNFHKLKQKLDVEKSKAPKEALEDHEFKRFTEINAIPHEKRKKPDLEELKKLEEKISKKIIELEKEFIKNLDKRSSHLESIPSAERADIDIKELYQIRRFYAEYKYDQKVSDLQEDFNKWVEDNDPHKDKKKLKLRLNNPQENVDSMKKILADNKDEYEAVLQKDPSSLNGKEKKLIKDYEGVKSKLVKWQKYSDQFNILNEEKQSLIEQLIKEEYDALKEKALKLLRSYTYYATRVEELFTQLNDPNYVQRTGNRYTSRGFSSHPDHHLLEFHQVMVGSYARALLDNQIFISNAESELMRVLENDNKASRGYLAHTGYRQEGKSFQESKDRPQVFYSNSKNTIAAKLKMTELSTIIQQRKKQEFDALSRITGSGQFYADDELNIIIRESLPENVDFVETAISRVPDELRTRLSEFILPTSTHQQLAVPLHINGNHFAALYIQRRENGYLIAYIDPMAHPMPQEIAQLIRDVFGQAQQITTTTNIIQTSTKQNGIEIADNNHCGAFVAHILSELSNGLMRVNHSNSRLERIVSNSWQNVPDSNNLDSNNFGRTLRMSHAEVYRNYIARPQNSPNSPNSPGISRSVT